jgi:uncharacterized protein involved in response to NO
VKADNSLAEDPPAERAGTVRLFCEEPFRIFFPVGLFLAATGVSLWILYYAGVISSYPGVSHARLMTEGFIASFVIGFLGTAGPRLLDAPHFSHSEFLVLLTLDLLSAGLHLGGANRAGDVAFSLCLIAFLVFLIRRFLGRRVTPPPNFALVALSLINGLAGTVLLALFEDQSYSVSYRLGSAFLQQGFPLLAIIGIAPFMLPLLLNLATVDDLPAASKQSTAWRMRAMLALLTGLALDLAFVLEAKGLTRTGVWLRVVAVAGYLGAQLPRTGQNFLGNSLRGGLAAIVLGFIAEALWPQLRVGDLHVVFITGYALVILTVATRVILGHSGNSHLFDRRLPFHIVAIILVTLAMFSRFTAELAPRARSIHLVAAAVLFLAAIFVWSIKLLPKITVVEGEDERM